MPRAEKDARRLGKQERRRVVAAIERFARELEGDVVKLTAVTPDEYRLRVGGLRVRFSRNDDAHVLTILRILPRDRAYRIRENLHEYGMEAIAT